MKEIRDILGDWYRGSQRDLPWRRTRDPYLIWLSEVILQQTRVAQGLSYYERFSEAFPDVASLASAEEREVLGLWQGLGYYSRARNLHHAARQVVEECGGEFPGTYERLLRLRGVGPYTAAAVASIASGEPRAVVDGNVERVLSRLFLVGETKGSTAFRKQVEALAGELLDPDDPGSSNQALMEFGALQCVPRNPSCDDCPLREKCLAFAAGKVGELPRVPAKKKLRERYFHYLVLRIGQGDSTGTLLRKRSANDIWRHLFEFPLHEHDATLEPEQALAQDELKPFTGLPGFVVRGVIDKVHVLSHQRIRARFIMAAASWDEGSHLPDGVVFVPMDRVGEYPVARLIEKLL